ncbi:MAG: hypothetical protein RI988_721 [Pseudomonadota bacterium]|jgi:hypothetical protein
MSYDNTNRGALFLNDKQGNDKRPDYSGKLDVGGKEYRIVAWAREGKRGMFLSLAVEEPRQGGSSAPAGRSVPPVAAVANVAGSKARSDEPFDDDIPF